LVIVPLMKVLEKRIPEPHRRSTFRDWAAERTSFPSDIVEMALAHATDSKVEAAYPRGDLFDKRQRARPPKSVPTIFPTSL
jgi:hypothetical protein